jgi:DNA-binding NarL/FixJ family response regulator
MLLYRLLKLFRRSNSNRRRALPCGFSFNRIEKSIFFPFITKRIQRQLHGEGAMSTLSDLTPREREILGLVLAGYTNKAIAGEILISEKTVEFHLDNIYTKTGARTRLLAGLWALQQGLGRETRIIPG